MLCSEFFIYFSCVISLSVLNICVIISENFLLLRFYNFSLLSKFYVRVGGWAKKVKSKIY